jgi:hypothetical protein
MFRPRRVVLLGLPLGVAAAGGGGWWLHRRRLAAREPTWPLWTREEVRDASNGGRVLVTFKDGVFDVTAFVARWVFVVRPPAALTTHAVTRAVIRSYRPVAVRAV